METWVVAAPDAGQRIRAIVLFLLVCEFRNSSATCPSFPWLGHLDVLENSSEVSAPTSRESRFWYSRRQYLHPGVSGKVCAVGMGQHKDHDLVLLHDPSFSPGGLDCTLACRGQGRNLRSAF